MATEQQYIGSPDNPRTAAVVSYITFIGWFISYFALYKGSKIAFTAFHLRQALLLHIISLLLRIVFAFTIYNTIIWLYLVGAFTIGLFILWLMGLIDALNGRERPVPVIGSTAQSMFKTL